jgi:thiamine biosynthesis lipoprotein
MRAPSSRLPVVLVRVLCAALAGPACGDDRSPDPPRSVDEQPPDPPPEDVRLYKQSRAMMGTIFEITVAGATEERAAPVVRRALDEIARLEDVLSEWRPESEVSRINSSAGRPAVAVGDDTMVVVGAGLEVSAWSDGAFDLSWAALRGLYDFGPTSDHRLPDPAELRRRVQLIDWRRIALDREQKTVRMPAGMSIGTGGLVKGYALDRASEILREGGLPNFMIVGGRQVQLGGRRGSHPWRVGLRHPRRQEDYAFLEATDASISTSGDFERFFVDARGRRWHHVLDPETGLPADEAVSATVIAPNGLYADALATACFVLGSVRCLEMMREHVRGGEAIIVEPDLHLEATPGTLERLRFTTAIDDEERLAL